MLHSTGTTTSQPARDYIPALIYLLDGLGLGIILPLLPFVVLTYGGSVAAVTWLVAIYAVSGLVGGVLLGAASDRIGRVALVKVSLAGSALAMLGMMMSPTLVGLFVFRALSGLMTGRDAVVRALVTDAAPPETHGEKMGTLLAAYAVGASTGPAISSAIGAVLANDADHFKAILALSAVLCLLALFLTHLRWRGPDAHLPPTSQDSVPNLLAALAAAAVPLALTFLGAVAYAPLIAVTALFGHDAFHWGAEQTGWLLVVVSIAIVAGRLLMSLEAFKALSLPNAFLTCGLVASVGLTMTSLAGSRVQFVSGLSLAGLGVTAASIVSSTMLSASAEPRQRGFVLGACQAISTAGIFVGAAASGPLYETFGRGAPYLAASGVLAGALLLVMARKPNPLPSPAA